ncbi:hypothetical protein [Psychrobacillus vulpis]|uniref:ArpU family transcriptional regulator n=1 Tax=Psychrobacillus vulpis TaxID=2325572 RepID=A0A544TWF6_9BACI|nr:hypothetical protein [Psychrobacillus vulpis]TQR21779.1 hypothetical protein FG384_02200 [Psychrobacillus vulpis]
MSSISTDEYIYFENKLYLPILIKILEKDLETIIKHPFKLTRPYIAKVESALSNIRTELKKTDVYITRYNMRLVKGKTNEDYTEYTFIKSGHEEYRKYTRNQLREKTEELMCTYITM